MSMSAAAAAASFLKTNPTQAEIEQKIESLNRHSDWAHRNMGPGMDGSARTLHMNATEIGMYKEHLRRVFGKEIAGYRCPMTASYYNQFVGSN